MKQPDKEARRAYDEIFNDMPTEVQIPDTKKIVEIRGLKPYTIERLTKLWLERDAAVPTASADTLKSMAVEPYFSIKQAVLMVLNSYWKIRLFYGLKWRIWAFWHNYTEQQMLPLLQIGKKKLPLTAHWSNMAFSVDMRTDWMKMTSKEAEQYRAELLSVVSQPSSISTPSTEKSSGE